MINCAESEIEVFLLAELIRCYFNVIEGQLYETRLEKN